MENVNLGFIKEVEMNYFNFDNENQNQDDITDVENTNDEFNNQDNNQDNNQTNIIDVDDVDDNLVYNEPQQVISQNNDEEFDYTWLKIITFLIFI